MKQHELYLKDIERHIEGVIKADDEEYLVQEVDEYVITKEIEKHLATFFHEYIKPSYNESVWISGFFGSGKSHLLKMLSLVLENREINGNKCGEIFAAKIKDDFELNANVKKAIAIPTTALLFNIAQKADGIGNLSSVDPILAVFLKVFNEFQNYYGQSPAVAEIERHMDEEGIFKKFKDIYQRINGKDWYTGRRHILLNRNEFSKAYAELKGISEVEAAKNFDDVRASFRLDIEGFVDMVKAYIAKQPPKFRIAFCVDEVGQFIAEDVKLMLSLQTLAETLSVACKGRAFLIVTSQNDLNATIGDMERQQAHDFSRIQGRFSVKLPLTSQNADEVIQERLLSKNDDGRAALLPLHEKEKNNFRTLFEFGDSSRQYPSYKSSEHFQLTYPFIPYQFDLFQSSIKGLSDHNAFMGKQQSVGERSMLGVFQQVAKANAQKDIKHIVTYSQMFDGIRDILQSNIQTDILLAERILENKLSIEVLKALFLVKYVKGFKATVRNITVLMLQSFEVDLAAFQKKVQEALNILEDQTFVQRIGETYEYLTNQEKDVEREIKNTDIDPKAPGELLADIIFSDILKDSKVKLDFNNQVYEFGKKLDDNVIGKERDFYVNFITPLNPNEIVVANIALKSIGTSDLIVHLPQDIKLFDELRLIRKTEKYVNTNNSANIDPTKQRILSEKAQQNSDRRRTLVIHLKEQIGNSRLYLNGSEVTDIGTHDAKTRISLGVQQLIRTTYTNLKMLSVNFTEDNITSIIRSQDDVLFKDTLSEVELEVLNRVSRNKANHDRTTTKGLLETFAARPYGWYQTAVLCLIAKLYKRNKISLKLDGSNLDDKGVLEALQSNREYGNTIIDLEEDISGSSLKKLKDFHQSYFNEANPGNEPKEVSRLFKLRMQREVSDVTALYMLKDRFSFLSSLGEPLNRLKLVTEKDHPYFFNALDQFVDDLLDDKENIVDTIKKFMNGAQKDIYESILTYLDSEKANFSYVAKSGIEPLMAVKESLTPYKGNLIQIAKQSLELLRTEVSAKLKSERERGVKAISETVEQLKSYAEFNKLNGQQQEEVLAPLHAAILEVNSERFIGNILAKVSYAKDTLYHQQIELMMRFANPPAVNAPQSGSGIQYPLVIYVRKDSVKVKFSKPSLENAQDVEDYVQALKDAYLKLIKEEKRISL